MDARVHVVEHPEALQALGHPLRVQILESLRSPTSAAAVARVVGQSRQNTSYHLKELEKAGLVRRVGERRTGSFVETLYEATAPTVLVSPRAVWGDARRLDALSEQIALERLVSVGERLGRDAAVLLDRATFDGEEIASAAVEATVRFASEADRASFMRDYLAAVGPLVSRYGERDGDAYKVAIAVYPDPNSEEQRST